MTAFGLILRWNNTTSPNIKRAELGDRPWRLIRKKDTWHLDEGGGSAYPLDRDYRAARMLAELHILCPDTRIDQAPVNTVSIANVAIGRVMSWNGYMITKMTDMDEPLAMAVTDGDYLSSTIRAEIDVSAGLVAETRWIVATVASPDVLSLGTWAEAFHSAVGGCQP